MRVMRVSSDQSLFCSDICHSLTNVILKIAPGTTLPNFHTGTTKKGEQSKYELSRYHAVEKGQYCFCSWSYNCPALAFECMSTSPSQTNNDRNGI